MTPKQTPCRASSVITSTKQVSPTFRKKETGWYIFLLSHLLLLLSTGAWVSNSYRWFIFIFLFILTTHGFQFVRYVGRTRRMWALEAVWDHLSQLLVEIRSHTGNMGDMTKKDSSEFSWKKKEHFNLPSVGCSWSDGYRIHNFLLKFVQIVLCQTRNTYCCF